MGLIDNCNIYGGIKTFVELLRPLQCARSADRSTPDSRHDPRDAKPTAPRLPIGRIDSVLRVLCTSYLRFRVETVAEDTNIQQKLRRLNGYVRFIDSRLLDDTLRSDIRNPLFHQGSSWAQNRVALMDWYLDYLNLLIQLILVILGYSGSYISPSTNAIEAVPSLGPGASV